MSDRLYNLLPAIYRQRDAAQGQPLRALLAVMEDQLLAIEADIDRLYDNWFIETCDEWVVPYIADLLGVRGLEDEKYIAMSQRSRVANTIRYRRRKGTLATLEQIIRDATGWHVRAVEFFKLLGLTQSVRHVRSGQGSTLDLRDASALETLGGPFETAAHMVDVRRKYNIPNIGLFICRCQSYHVTRSLAHNIKKGAEGQDLPDGCCYTFHPLGFDAPLFNLPQTKTGTSRMLEGRHLAFPIRMEDFAKDLRDYKQRYQDTPENLRPLNSEYYGPDRSVNIIRKGIPLSPMNVVCQSLQDWVWVSRPKIKNSGNENDQPIAAMDVGRGRLKFEGGKVPDSVKVSFTYGFSADIGGGPYDRQSTLIGPRLGPMVTKQDPKTNYNSLTKVLKQIADRKDAVITIMDNRTYTEDLSLELSSGRHLVIQARDGFRPVLHGNLSVQGNGALTLNGLLIKGDLTVNEGVEVLNLLHCSLIPNQENSPSVSVDLKNDRLRMMIDRCIVGPLRLPAGMSSLRVRDSIIDSRLGMQSVGSGAEIHDNQDLPAIGAENEQPGPPTMIERTTVFGAINVKELSLASEVIFTAPVKVENRQTGGVRYSFVPSDSRTPQRFRCQPDLEIATRTSAQEEEDDKIRDDAVREMVPTFTSTEYGQPGYAQLHFACPKQIRAGAADESEMGAFSHLKQPQREANLRKVLEEFLPLGLEADIIYI